MKQDSERNFNLFVMNKISSPNRRLSEKSIASVLEYHLLNFDYFVLKEFVVSATFLNMQKLSGEKISKKRIDVAALKDGKIIFIEVENGLWMTHPVQYQNFANFVYLAYPAEAEGLTDRDQIEIAKKSGIGILKISSVGSISTVLRAKEKQLEPEVEKIIKALFKKRLKGQTMD